MQFLITFIEGIVSFISPCTLPLLPVYISYFAGDADEQGKTALRAASFVLGFTIVFSIMGLFAGSLGALLQEYKTIVDIVCGVIVIIFGLSYMDIIPLKLFRGLNNEHKATGIISAFLFGMIFSVNLTPCVGAFLGSALMMAATSGEALKGLALMVVYSIGFGVPMILSAVLIEKLKNTISFLKKHYKVINLVSGIFLIIVGIAIAFGYYNKLNLGNNTKPETNEVGYIDATDFTVYDAAGNEVRLSDYEGKPVVVNFWATWCRYCIEEFPTYIDMKNKYEDVEFLFVNATDGVRETKEKAMAYIEEAGFDIESCYDTEASAVTAYNVSSLPVSLFIDEEGRLVNRHLGKLDASTLEKNIDLIIK